ncbi:class I SAM-dependent methyltransferase [Abyssibacter profundi]|uniref:Methyltransferase n=1 Tax=Abyssibacter profundi TaxID=2182787 RepID=A0A363UJ34_9GAMM|nr:class I SAM-dependent methyltransferase [Abyssibacter profundi]PWN55367.1 methyltransferase [Abyssibacter profundi]
MKALVRTLRRLSQLIRREVTSADTALITLVERRISEDIAQRCVRDGAVVFEDQWLARRHCAERLRSNPADGLNLEFGVFRGRSINFFAEQLPSQTFHGFDSFEGLPSGNGFWARYFSKGRFDLGGRLPPTQANVTLHAGWIEETLPAMLKTVPDEPVRFAHIDTDIYESARQILELIEPRLRPGSILLFDEYCNYPGFTSEEYRAFQEFVATAGVEYRIICAAMNERRFGALGKVAMEILSINH